MLVVPVRQQGQYRKRARLPCCELAPKPGLRVCGSVITGVVVPVVAVFHAGSVKVHLNEKVDALRKTKQTTKQTRDQREKTDEDLTKEIWLWDYSTAHSVSNGT